MGQSRELRVFISSTFRDLQEERNYLSKKIFPSIRALCRERGVEFTEIDLRWGLTEEEAHNGLVIRSCLEEIDRCRPYFIGIVGSRYGWVPEHHIIQRDPELIRRYPWIEDAAADGKSIIEMEFDYGALADPRDAEHAFFYLPHSTRGSTDTDARLAALKDRIHNSGIPVREYSSPAMLGERIRKDLIETIEKRWQAMTDVSALDQERKQHIAFAVNRRHAYIANPENIQKLSAYATSSWSVPLVVTAPSGAGKSALLAYWSDWYRRRNPACVVLEHYVGVSTRGNTEHAVLCHIIEEIRSQFVLEASIPPTTIELVADFPLWLSRTQGKQVIIVIDALNQLDETPHRFRWLPEYLPDNVKLIVSITDPVMFDMPTQGFGRLELNALSLHEREAIIVRFLGEYHKSLSVQEARLIASDPKSERPLFLRTLLEEIRLYGSHHDLLERIHVYLSCSDLEELFQRVLERLESDYGPHIVRDLMTVIWASRRGIPQEELEHLIHGTHEHLSTVLYALDYHLLKREDRYAFFHEYLRTAVEKRYLAQSETRTNAHARIAAYLSTSPRHERRIEEEPWQLLQAGAWQKLRASLVDRDLFELLASKEHQYELLGYWRGLKEKYDLVEEYAKTIETSEELSLLTLLASFYRVSGLYDAAERLYKHILDLAAARSIPAIESAAWEEELAEVLYFKSSLEESAARYRQAAQTYTRAKGEYDTTTLGALNGYGLLLLKNGQTKNAIDVLQQCLYAYTEHHTNRSSDKIPIMLNLALSYYTDEQFDKAISLMRQALDDIAQFHGARSVEAIIPLTNLGAMLRRKGDHVGARDCCERALALGISYLGRRHPLSLTAYYNLGMVHFFEGEYEAYLTLATYVFQERLRQLGIAHRETLGILQWMCSQSSKHPTIQKTAGELLDQVWNISAAESIRPDLLVLRQLLTSAPKN